MYKAMYDFVGTDSRALTFRANDSFTLLENDIDGHWWLVQNGCGEVGYVPVNYLCRMEGGQSEVLQSIDRAIKAIESQARGNGGRLTEQQDKNLKKLNAHRQKMIEEFTHSNSQYPVKMRGAPPIPQEETHRKSMSHHENTSPKTQNTRTKSTKRMSAPPPPSPTQENTNASVSSNIGQQREERHQSAHHHSETHSRGHHHPRHTHPAEEQIRNMKDIGTSPVRTLNSTHQNPQSPSRNRTQSLPLPVNITEDLVEQMRRNTGLSYAKSRIAVGTVIAYLKDNVPSTSAVMEEILKSIMQDKQEGSSSSLEVSRDAVRLQEILTEMAACKDDSQQRSWALHEDEKYITSNLEELLNILNEANEDISREVLKQDDYEALHTLVLYYQMETRNSIRMLLLQVFGALCGLNARIISELLCSVLPLELARDMQASFQDISRFTYSALALTMILSMGEQIPVGHYNHLNKDFIMNLLNTIDNPPEEDVQDQVPDLLVNLLLAFNLHFHMPSENLVMEALHEVGTAKTFSEKLMLLVNRGDDPVRLFSHEPAPPHSVLKCLMDMYSSKLTSGLLYTNDAKVLIDITLRQISDLTPGDQMRTEYLSLLHLIITKSDYAEHMHRHSELQIKFSAIFQEEEPKNDMDKLTVQQIWDDCPEFFTNKYA